MEKRPGPVAVPAGVRFSRRDTRLAPAYAGRLGDCAARLYCGDGAAGPVIRGGLSGEASIFPRRGDTRADSPSLRPEA